MSAQQHQNPRKRTRSCSDQGNRRSKALRHSNPDKSALPTINIASRSSRERTSLDSEVTGEPANQTQRHDKENVRPQHPQGVQTVASPRDAIECEEAYDADEECENDTEDDSDDL